MQQEWRLVFSVAFGCSFVLILVSTGIPNSALSLVCRRLLFWSHTLLASNRCVTFDAQPANCLCNSVLCYLFGFGCKLHVFFFVPPSPPPPFFPLCTPPVIPCFHLLYACVCVYCDAGCLWVFNMSDFNT
jgi:hypothetical protein